MPHRLLDVVAHRPWPLPRSPWVMYQRWDDLLFMHWPVSREALARLVPRQLQIDTFDDEAWVGVVPFRIPRLRPRTLPPVPGMAAFPELNVRTYVRVGDTPGVYFFSLDAGSRLAVEAARIGYALPYFRAHMRVDTARDRITYRCVRADARARPAEFIADYGPTGPVAPAPPSSLADWLTARYCLYAVRGSRVLRADIHHLPWPLQPATASVQTNTMAASHGIHLPDRLPLLHFARSLEVLIWAPTRIVV